MSNGILVVVSAPSGAGKTTLVKHLRKQNPEIVYSVSWTTRLARSNEKNGEDYLFVSETEFLQCQQQAGFVESAQVHGYWYGTPKGFIQEQLSQGKDVILDIDVQGGQQIRKLFPKAVMICIVPPSLDVLRNRLKNRKQDDEKVIEKRLKVAQSEFQEAKKGYDYFIINDQIDKAVHHLRCILEAEHLRQPNENLKGVIPL